MGNIQETGFKQLVSYNCSFTLHENSCFEFSLFGVHVELEDLIQILTDVPNTM
jgi:hypothetical protein